MIEDWIGQSLHILLWLIAFFLSRPNKASLDKLIYRGLLKRIKKHITERIFGASFRDMYLASFYRKTYAATSKDIMYLGKHLY